MQPDNQPLLSETVEAISDDAFLPATVEAGNLLQSTEQVAILSEPEESTEAFVPSFWEKTFALLVPKNKLWLNMLLIVGYATLFMTITISMADPQMFAKGYHGDLFSSVSALTFIIIPTGIMLAGKLLGVWRGTLSILLCIAFTWRLVVFYHLPFGVDQADLNRTIIGIVITTFVVGLLWLGISKFITMDNDNKPENASDKETANCLLISISPAITLVGTALLWGILSRSFDFWGIVQWLLVTILSAIGVSILEWVVFMVLGILRMVLFTLYRVVSTYKSK